MLSKASEKSTVTKWALIAVVLVVMLGAALFWTKKEVPTTATRIAKSGVRTISRGSEVALPAKFSEEFDRFDANGDGVIDEHEFVAALAAKTGIPMTVLHMPTFQSKLDELYRDVLHASKPKDSIEKDVTKQGMTKAYVARMIREYGLTLSYDRNTLKSFLQSFLNDPSLQPRSDATSPKTTYSPEVRMVGAWLHQMEKDKKKSWKELRAETGTLKKGAQCEKESTKKWCGGYSCGASDKFIVKYACCKEPTAFGRFRPKHAQCACCTSERGKGACVWDGSLVEKRNGLVRLDSVDVGDEVYVGNGDFDVVIYVERASLVDMLNIEVVVTDGILTNTTRLMLTPNHMVVKEDGILVEAGNLHVGDKVGCDTKGKTCIVMGVSSHGKGSARSIFLQRSNHFIANGIQTSSFTDSPRVMNALLSAIINPVRWIWRTTNMSRDHPLFFLVKAANRVFSWTIDPLVRSETWRQIARDLFGMMAHS